MTMTTRPVGLLQMGERTHLRVQLQFDRHGDRAQEVAAWITGHYQHLDCESHAQPGLTVSMLIPEVGMEGFEGWHARLMATLSPVDVALELLAQCFSDLGLEPASVVSLHVT